MALLDDLYDYLYGNFKSTNLATNTKKYVNPNVTVGYDPDTPYSGYAPNSNLKSIVLNPNPAVGGQRELLDTYAHEMAHTDQGHPLRILNGAGGTPGWQLRGMDFPYYDRTSNPPPIEQAATIRANEAMAKAGTPWWGTGIGEDVLNQLKQKYQYGKQRAGYSEEQLKGQIEALLYPPDPRSTHIKKPQGK